MIKKVISDENLCHLFTNWTLRDYMISDLSTKLLSQHHLQLCRSLDDDLLTRSLWCDPPVGRSKKITVFFKSTAMRLIIVSCLKFATKLWPTGGSYEKNYFYYFFAFFPVSQYLFNTNGEMFCNFIILKKNIQLAFRPIQCYLGKFVYSHIKKIPMNVLISDEEVGFQQFNREWHVTVCPAMTWQA